MAGVLYWTLTTNCNLSCSYCFITRDKSCTKSDTDLRLCKLALPQLRKYFDKLILTGGEVLILPELFDFIKEAKSLKFKIVIITNGVLLNSSNIENIIRNDVDGVSVSIDSFDDSINDFLRGRSLTVKQNISELIKHGFPSDKIKLLMTVTRKNINSLPELLEFCLKNKTAININPVEISSSDNSFMELDLRNCDDQEKAELKSHFSKWAVEDKRKISYAKAIFELIDGKKPEKISCSMGSESFVIYPSGEVYPCFYQLKKEMGNIFTENPDKIFAKTAKSTLYRNGCCISLQCVCMTNTYNQGIISRLFEITRFHFKKNR